MAGPIQRDHAYRQVIACWGLSSLGRRIRRVLDDTLGAIADSHRPTVVGDTLWPVGVDEARWVAFRVVDPQDPDTKRRADEIPPAEIANAAAWVLERAKTISREDLARETARAFGIDRLGTKVRATMEVGIDRLAARGRCELDGDRITVVD